MSTAELFAGLENRYKLPSGYLSRVYQIESSGGKKLYNEASGATGPFQFMPRTARAMGLQNPNDLAESAEAAARLAAQNREELQRLGIKEVDGRLLYLAHNQGAAGAYRLLSNADQPADALVGEGAVTLNSGQKGQPAAQFANVVMSKYEGGESASAAPYSALGEAAKQPEQKAEAAPEEDRRSSRREAYALNTLMAFNKELEQKPAPMLAIPRLSYADGGIVSLVDGEQEEAASQASGAVGGRFGISRAALETDTPRPTPILFGGERAEGIDREKLEEARRMIAEGRDPKEVYAQTRTPNTTGWFVGPDGRLRFEFSDKDAALDDKVFDKIKSGETTTLGNILKHDDLFKFYPSAKDVQVRTLTKEEEDSGSLGFFDTKNNLLAVSKDPKEARATILHETQHYVQDNEGFSPGGSPTAIVPMTQLNFLFAEGDLHKQYFKIRDEERREAKLLADKLIEEKKYGEATQVYKNLTYPRAEKFREENIFPLQERAGKYQRLMTELGDYESYRRLSGETEARNVETRLPMSLEERAASFPLETQQYPTEQQFVVPRGFADGGIVSLVKDASLSDEAERVRAAGRNNDTVLAHITPREAMALKAMGGAGTINPFTGLLEFDDGGGGEGGGGSDSGSDSGSSDSGSSDSGSSDSGSDDGGGGNEGGEADGSDPGDSYGFTGALGESFADAIAGSDPYGDIGVNFDVANFTSSDPGDSYGYTGALGDALSDALAGNDPYGDIATNFDIANFISTAPEAPAQTQTEASSPYGTLAGNTFNSADFLGPAAAGAFSISGPVGISEAQEANTSLAGVFGPQDLNSYLNADISPYVDMPSVSPEANVYGALSYDRSALGPSPEQQALAQQLATSLYPTAPEPLAPSLPAVIEVPTLSVASVSPYSRGPASTTSTTSAPAATSTPSSPVTSYISDRISSAFSNPAALATNAAVSLVPGLGPLNAISGILGGPTVGGALFGQSPDKATSSTGYDLNDPGPEAPGTDFGTGGQDNLEVATGPSDLSPGSVAGSSAPFPTLNPAALIDLAKFVSSQSQLPSTPTEVSPYIGSFTGGAPVSTTPPVPQFATISYPTRPV